ncbi:MAG: phenylacetate-CoA oxygenase subunit PaaI [Pseudomonadota bacterium]|jgi:ring-1,2-phenylacetyl-CoA epoxidase subunit PaaC
MNPNPLFEYLLRLGDNNLILAQRLSSWCGHGPVLEEDIALANIALDLLGQARMWLTLAGEAEGKGRDEDKLAYHRNANEFRNLLLVEQDNGNFADTMARQFYYDQWNYLLLGELQQSSDARIAAIAEKSFKEVSYHIRRSSEWIIMLGDGTAESHTKIQQAIDRLWPYTGQLFDADVIDEDLINKHIACDVSRLHDTWLKNVTATLAEATLRLPTTQVSAEKQGAHSESFEALLAEMQILPRTYPNATW